MNKPLAHPATKKSGNRDMLLDLVRAIARQQARHDHDKEQQKA